MFKLLRHRAFLRGLSRAQRRQWFEQAKSAAPRVPIATLPQRLQRSYAYVRLV
ncbi:conserved hypothetical protein [Cupriavidus taiwanensis]|uniref:hypothetical protein n=1 Tax=Cupriavidus taiwanensis TaxID=164546 RepID=UPI000E19AC79|nr:hypothetical protein [Cupriavidus taiwanensis]SOZ99479.1 conserved hypothetical protein [Cupriavidus taiwanensis]